MIVVVPEHDLVALSRSAAMIQPGASLPVEREVLIATIEELLETRRLLRRLGADLKTVARRSTP